MNDRHTDQEFGIYHLSTKIGDTKIYSRFRGKNMINLGIPLTSHLDCHLQYPECLWKISKRLANDPPFSPIDPWKKAISRSHCMVLQENATDKIKISSCPRKKLVEVCPQIWRGKHTWQFSALHAVSLAMDMFRKCKSPYHCQVRSGQGWSSDSRTNFSQAQCPKTTICSSNIHSSHTSLRLNLHHLFKGIFWYDSNLSTLEHTHQYIRGLLCIPLAAIAQLSISSIQTLSSEWLDPRWCCPNFAPSKPACLRSSFMVASLSACSSALDRRITVKWSVETPTGWRNIPKNNRILYTYNIYIYSHLSNPTMDGSFCGGSHGNNGTQILRWITSRRTRTLPLLRCHQRFFILPCPIFTSSGDDHPNDRNSRGIRRDNLDLLDTGSQETGWVAPLPPRLCSTSLFGSIPGSLRCWSWRVRWRKNWTRETPVDLEQYCKKKGQKLGIWRKTCRKDRVSEFCP